ncbi:hypothetical protein QQS21_009114 [Conoideocrella luteorostrata]|uniref:Uncharacterized protein n=1 Tax=Conoideocrella luteorostrata TaxID=1105319 RepID=A0AAJ0CHU2_9HYPO|nr:hypothetical protein QQS21_009114 [Conoideocrella luteorostrata]
MELTDSDPANPVYAAVPEVFHQLHCLNLVRRYTWPVSMYNKSWGQLYPSDRENLVASRMHVDHCIEALRLSLMCYSDITPSFILYDANLKYGKGDFNVYHKCRDFHKISDYVREHGGEMRTNDVADKHP